MEVLGRLCALVLVCAVLAQDFEAAPEGKQLRDFNQNWRGLDTEWTPQATEPEIKRQRIRKRKRRPVFTEETRRPQRLDQIRDPWEEITVDVSPKTNNRRRLMPVYNEEVKIRDPFTALKEAEEKQRPQIEENTTKTPDLKTLLKQSGGLSLSEVLQQKNLTLDELLQGNEQAISVLARETETTTEIVTTEFNKYRRLPPSVGLKRDRNSLRNSASKDTLSSNEVREAQRKRLTLLHSQKDKTQTEIEQITEKPVDQASSTTETPRVIITKRLPITSAKLTKLITKSPENSKVTPISVNEIFGFNADERNETRGPLKMVIDFGEATTEMLPLTKEKNLRAQEELMEILKNPLEREKLARILRTRNMTVEELVAQRERGSSQSHLADIFHNKTKEPEPAGEPFVGQIQPDLPIFKRKPKTIPIEVTTIPEKIEESTTKLAYTITSFPTYKIETNKDFKSVPIWHQLYPQFTPEAQTTVSSEKLNSEEIERLEEIENALAEAANERLKVEIPKNLYEEEEEFINIPSGVKSAILASLAIIGLSLLVFLTILLFFKWTQKHKRRLTYNESFLSSKSRAPILEPCQRRTFKTFVCETLGKKKNYYKAHLHNMSDSIWDREDKKPYMI